MCEMSKHTNTHDTWLCYVTMCVCLALETCPPLPDTGSVWENNMLTGQESWIWGRHHLTIS